MAIKYELKMTNRAKKDLDNIYNYISKCLMEDKIAQNLINKIEKEIFRLETFPESCAVIDNLNGKNKIYRKLVINNYIVIYRIDKKYKMIYIVRVVYGGRNYLKYI